jgi:hydroxypyruvate isomerase
MNKDVKLSRRQMMTGMAGVAGAVLATGAKSEEKPSSEAEAAKAGRLKQSVCRWCYGGMSLDDLCKNAVAMGLRSIDLLSENEWAALKPYGLTCAMPNGPGGITDGWNRPADHDKLVKESERLLPLVKAAGLPNMIVFSGNRRGLSDSEGLKNCAAGLKRIVPLAEELGVTLCMELLNSKRNHHDYQCDHTAWGVNLAKEIGSDRFKLLYDIYHMQIMEGDVIATIRENIQYIGHFHTGGVPGRNEIDDTQELNYRRIAQAIADLDFKGFLAHEFIPKRDPMTSLRQAVRLCTV